MNNIILQHFTGELRELDRLSVANISEYAESIGTDYELVRGQVFKSELTPPCQKVFMIDEKWDEYDNVLMLDIDMFLCKGCEIDVFSEQGIGLYDVTQQRLHQQIAQKFPLQASTKTPYWGGAIYKMDLETRKTLRRGLTGTHAWMEVYNKPYHFEDEGIMHSLAHFSGLQIDQPYLDTKWCQDSFKAKHDPDGFIHIRTKITPRGPKQEKIENYKVLRDAGKI